MGNNQKSTAIIGGGMTGLSAAYDLAMQGNEVTVYEASDHVGGLAAGFKEPHWDWTVERYYHHWFASDKHILNLIDELGWSEKVIFPRPVTVIYHQGKFYPFDSILAALKFPGLGWGVNKIRFGLVGMYLRLTTNWQKLESMTVDAWMRKWAGDKVYESMWEPMMNGKFGEDFAREVNMAWFWARMFARTTRLGTFKGGFQHFMDQFARHLKEKGVSIRFNSHVKSIQKRDGNGFYIITGSDQPQNYDQVLATVSPAMMAKLTPELPKDYLQVLNNLKSIGSVVMVFALKHQLSEQDYYWYNIPKSAGFPFLSLVEHTNFLSPDYFGGEHIVYVGDYLPSSHEHFTLSQEALQARFIPHLNKINPAFSPDWIRKSWMFRTAYAQPIPMLNHSAKLPGIRTPISGLYYASMSQVYPWDRGMNYAVELGRRVAGMMDDGI